MKDIKHIRRDFHLAAWVMPQGGWDLGVPRGFGASKFSFTKFYQIWCVSYLHEWHMHRRHFWVPAPWGPGDGPKSKISLNLNYLDVASAVGDNFKNLGVLSIESSLFYLFHYTFIQTKHHTKGY